MKLCTKCLIFKDSDQFYKDARRKDELMSACKRCHKKYNRNQIKYKAQWYQNNKKRLHKKASIYNKIYRKEIKPWFIHYDKAKQRCINPKDDSYKWYGDRGIKFLLTLKQVEYLWFRDKAWLLKQPSIDRIDNDGNYELGNCRFIELLDNIKRRRKKL